jgi:hypothetical protein
MPPPSAAKRPDRKEHGMGKTEITAELACLRSS